MKNSKYNYARFGSKGKRVGQAAYDILSKDQPTYSAEEVQEGMNEKYVEEFKTALDSGSRIYDGQFHILVLTNKALGQFGVSNVMRNYFVTRKTAPKAQDMLVDYPHYVKTLYEINSKKSTISLCWSIPGIEDCKTIMKNPVPYDPTLVGWVKQLFRPTEPVDIR